MGAALSYPTQPLIELNARGNNHKILIPPRDFRLASSRFPYFPRSRRSKDKPTYHRARATYKDKYGDTYEDEYSYRPQPRKRANRPLSDDTMSDSFDIRPRRGPRTRKTDRMPMDYGEVRAAGRGMGVGMDLGMGIPTVYYDPRNVRAMSAPDLNMAYGPLPKEPYRLGAVDMHPLGGMRPDMPIYGPPLGYAPGVASPSDGNPYAHAQPAAPSYQVPVDPQIPLRALRRRKPMPTGASSDVQQIAEGVYAAQPQPKHVRRKAEKPVSDRLNRTQTATRRVGPSGEEWIGGDPFLDACTCDDDTTKAGEIRYIIRDDLGKDCGDHSKCHVHDEDDSDGGRRKTKDEKERRRDRESTGALNRKMVREELDAALGKKVANMNLGGRQMGPMDTGVFNSPFGDITQGGFPGMMEGLDPRTTQRLSGDDPYGMGLSTKIPQRMGGMIRGRPNGIPGMGMPRPVGLTSGIGFGGHVPFSDADMDEMMNPMMGVPPYPQMVGDRRLKAHRKFRAGQVGARPPPGMDPRMEQGGPSRRGNMTRPRQRRGRRLPLGFDPDFDDESMGSDKFGPRGQPSFLPMDGDEGRFMDGLLGKISQGNVKQSVTNSTDGEDNYGMRQGPPGGRRGGGSLSGRQMGREGRGREHQARVDEDDDDI
ncbi:hypothetical protein N0V90_006192 [Kalmusia sp. IMI 367209]|nr:hypothetical protein N0V90_006192 [Kalmusia sp. IMI 367209]